MAPTTSLVLEITLACLVPWSAALRPSLWTGRYYEEYNKSRGSAPNTWARGATRIPRIIWYTHRDKNKLTDNFERRLQDLNPAFSLRFVSDESALNFISDSFPEEYVEAYRKIDWPPHRADMWRYMVLLDHGGYYIDTDDELLVPAEELAGPNDFVSVIAARSAKGVHIHNGILGTVPGNPIVKQLLDHMLQHPKPEPTYALSPYHYYCRYFYELMNASLSSVGGLRPLTQYRFMGMNMSFLYHEAPFRYVIDNGDNEGRRLVASMGTNLKQWTEGNTVPVYTLWHYYPVYMDVSTKAWQPFLNNITAHNVTPLANGTGIEDHMIL